MKFNQMATRSVRKHRSLYGLAFFITLTTFYTFYSGLWTLTGTTLKFSTPDTVSCFADDSQHPIDQLICDASAKQQRLIRKRTTNVKNAAKRYRERRGRHPPPGFDKWFQFASTNKAIVVEELFDQIYTDLEPFWGLAPGYIRLFSRSYNNVISIRSGVLRRYKTIPFQYHDVVGRWMDMISHIPSEDLPDVDMAFNLSDEPHMFVSWEEVNARMEIARAERHTNPPTLDNIIINGFTRYPPIQDDFLPEGHIFPSSNNVDSVWGYTQKACPPGSRARSYSQDTDMTVPARWPTGAEDHFHRGFVSNWTSAQNACDNPYISNMHGAYIGMQILDWGNPTVDKNGYIWTQLVPLFSYCKIQGVNQDILVPAAVYWPENPGEDGFSVSDRSLIPWKTKDDKLTWYGSASGGWNNASTWTRYQRHRLVSMMNGTQVTATEDHLNEHDSQPPQHLPGGNPELPHNFPLPTSNIYDIAALKEKATGLGKWVLDHAKANIVDLRCFPFPEWVNTNSAGCPYSGRFYNVIDPVKHTEALKSKYVPDIDGASFSGRYLGFLTSASVPIKATIFSEWHDSRLIPWQHFVPMDNSFVDFWGIVDYFLGYDKVDGDGKGVSSMTREAHDKQGKAIGQQGRDWVKTALRPEDMVVYMYRLILEFARISDDNRVDMGFIDDLL